MDLRELARIVEARRDDFVDALREMVNVDCGSFSPNGVNHIADLCEERFRANAWDVERIPHRPAGGEPQLGDLVIGRREGDGPRVLLIGHMDTVFPDGTAAERPFRIEGDRAFGPGVSDMKGGLLMGFFAVEALLEAGARPAVTYVCNPDEEIGSPFSRAHIQRVARDADVCFVLEGARENGDIVSARKGVADLRIEITGRAAHAGVEPEKGRNAIVEAAYKVLALSALNGRWDGVTVNAGVIEGGTRPNVVPERCVIEVDLRSSHEDTFEEARQEAIQIAERSTVDGTTSGVEVHGWHRPMERSPASARLVEVAKAVAAELGFEVRDAATGGASDANTTSAMGVPTLDGLGPIGGDDHSPSEWMDLPSVVPRIALLAGLVARAGEAI